MRLAVCMARVVRLVGLVLLLGTSVGCARGDREAAPTHATHTTHTTSSPETKIGRWRGRVVEQHAQFVRYSFAAAGEPDMVVELARRRPDHSTEFGTDALAVQPAPGAQVTPELLQAVTAWLRAGGPGPDELFAAPTSTESSATRPAPEPPRLIRGVGLGLLGAWLVALCGSSLAGLAGRRRRTAALADTDTSRATPIATVGGVPLMPLLPLLLLLLLIMVAVVGLRLSFAAPSPLDDDAMSDIGMGLACAAGDPCLHGATASFGGFEHGTGFPRLLGWLLALGLDVAGLQVVLIVLAAVGVAVTFDVGHRLAGPRDGAIAGALAAVALLGLQLTELASTGDILWNPAAMALPAALTQAALTRGAATGRAGWLLLAGLLAGLAFEAHVSGLALWPGLVIVAAATADANARERGAPSSRLRELGARMLWLPALAGAVGVTMVVSPASAQVNGRAIVDHVGALACVAALVGCLVVGSLLRKTKAWVRSALALAVPIVTLVVTLAAAAGFVGSLPLRYLAPVFPAVALSAGWLASAALARVARARIRVAVAGLTAGLVLVVTLPAYLDRMEVDRDRWTYADLDLISTFLEERGVGREDLHHAIRGARCGSESHGDRGQRLAELVVGGLRAWGGLGPKPGAGAGVQPAWVQPAWLVAKLRNSDVAPLPEGASALPSGDAHTIVMAPYQPALDLAGIRYCTRFEHGEDRCVLASPQPVNLAARQLLPRHGHAADPEHGAAAVAYYYELPLRWPAEATANHSATLQLDARSSSMAWRFVNVQGEAGLDGQAFPTTTLDVTLVPGATATVTLAKDGPASPDPWWPPIVEVPADPRMQAIFLPPPAGPVPPLPDR